MNHPKVFEYMGWQDGCDCHEPCNPKEGIRCCIGCKYYIPKEYDHPLDGNDMVAAIGNLAHDEAWQDFCDFAKDSGCEDNDDVFWMNEDMFTAWLCGNPENFFNLMEKWLEC